MLRPVIMIGCGGSGQKAVRYIRDSVRRQLAHSGWTGEFPRAWRFIGLDTLNIQEAPGEIPTMPSTDYLSVSLAFNTYAALDKALLATHGPGTPGYRELIGWRPEASQVQVPLQAGAGQMRAVGRAAGVVSLATVVRPKIQEAFSECSAGAPELQRVSEHLGVPVPAGTAAPQPLVVVLGSMAGGTGAGIMLDVIDLVRRTNDGGAYPLAVVFSADIFGEQSSDSMSANGMAFMSELMSAYWDNELSGSNLIPANVATDNRGPHSVFIIGRKNLDGIDLRTSKNVYRAVGEALGTWVMSGNVQEQIYHFITVNWPPASRENQGGYPFGREFHPGVVSSFGSSTLSIGRDRFRDFAQKLFLRETVEHLYQGHRRRAAVEFGSDAKNLTDTAMVARLTRDHRAEFLNACGLNELGENQNQVQERFTDDAKDELARIRSELSAPVAGQERSGDEWATLMLQQADSVKVRALTDATKGFDKRVVEWGPEVFDRTLRVSSAFAGEFGLKVAAELVGAAFTEVEAAAAEVLHAANTARAQSQTAREEGTADLRALGTGKVQFANSSVQGALDKIARSVALEWLHLRRQKVSEAMDAFAQQVLKPLQAKIEMAHGQVYEMVTPIDGEPALIETWPSDNGGVPESFLPSPVEFFLEDVTSWPGLVNSLSSEATEMVLNGSVHGVKYQPSGAVDATRYLMACGDFPAGGDRRVEPLIWVEDIGAGGARWTPGGQPRISVAASIDDLEERVNSWMSRPSSVMARTLNEGLRSYLQDTDSAGQPIKEHPDRLRRFRQKLGEAINQSRPLIEIDTALNAVVHPAKQKIEVRPLVQGFPFPVGHPAREIVDEMLATKTGGDSSGRFVDRDAESVLISSFIHYPVHPMVVTSICQPLGTAVDRLRANPTAMRSAFWLWRRTKTLEDFVPLHDDSRRAMIRGFAIARMMGYITADPGRPVEISSEKGPLRFPFPLLTYVSQNNILPALLEAFPLTLAEAPTRQVSAFDAFKRLHDLGVRQGSTYSLPAEISDFMLTGRPKCQPLDPLRAERCTPHVPDSEDGTEVRRAAMVKYIDDNLARYRRIASEEFTGQECRDQYGAVQPEDTLSHEIISDLLSSFEEVKAALAAFGKDDGVV